MPQRAAVSVADPIIDQLNALRVRRGGGQGLELDQIAFRAKALGLKASTRAQFLAITGMIAVVGDDLDGLRAAATALEIQYPNDFNSQVNILLSLMVMRARVDVESMVERLAPRFPHAMGVFAGALLGFGNLTGTVGYINRHGRNLPKEYFPTPIWNVASAMISGGIGDQTLSDYVEGALSLLRSCGWFAPAISIYAPLFSDDHPELAISRFRIDGTGAELIEAEDLLADGLIARNDPIFLGGSVVCSVMPFEISA